MVVFETWEHTDLLAKRLQFAREGNPTLWLEFPRHDGSADIPESPEVCDPVVEPANLLWSAVNTFFDCIDYWKGSDAFACPQFTEGPLANCYVHEVAILASSFAPLYMSESVREGILPDFNRSMMVTHIPPPYMSVVGILPVAVQSLCLLRRFVVERASERTNERTNERLNGRTNERTNERVSERTNERTNDRTNERAGERASEPTNQ